MKTLKQLREATKLKEPKYRVLKPKGYVPAGFIPTEDNKKSKS